MQREKKIVTRVILNGCINITILLLPKKKNITILQNKFMILLINESIPFKEDAFDRNRNWRFLNINVARSQTPKS